jgi:hypothetical protein
MIMDTQEQRLTWLALFVSTGTLICCALPIALVSLGLGATAAAMSTSLPFLVSLSLHKIWVFGGSALLLVLAAWALYRSGRTCPADPELAALCERTLAWNRRVFWGAMVLWGIGFFAAYLALPIRIWMDG